MTPLSSLSSLSSPSQWPNKSCTLRVLPLTLALKSCASWYCFPICSITLKCLLMHFLVHSRCDKSRNQRRNGKRKMSISKPKKRQNRKKSRSKDYFSSLTSALWRELLLKSSTQASKHLVVKSLKSMIKSSICFFCSNAKSSCISMEGQSNQSHAVCQ